jgi:hypothetical protein
VFWFAFSALALRDFDFDFLGTIVRDELEVTEGVHEIFSAEIILVQKADSDRQHADDNTSIVCFL